MGGMSPVHTLVVVRHAKSDWSGNQTDRDRPLARRGHRQAPLSGRWLASSGLSIDRAVVSPAERARATWALISAELAEAPTTMIDEDVYAFSATSLLRVVRAFPDAWATVALVGHNPGLEDLVEELSGVYLPMPTSAVAVLRFGTPWREAGRETAGAVLAHGRPPEGPLASTP